MAAIKELPTILSTKGQVVLPKEVRSSRGWTSGERLVWEDRPEGVLLRTPTYTSPFPPTRLEDVRGMLKYDGPPITDEDMSRGVAQEARRRWARFEATGTDYEEEDSE